MILYILKSSLCLGLLLGFYFLFLEKEKMPRFNRMYLLGSMMVAILIPLIQLPVGFGIEMGSLEGIVGSDAVSKGWGRAGERFVNVQILLIGGYVLIGSLLLVRFGRNLYTIIRTIRSNPHVELDRATLVLVAEPILPYTFGKYICVDQHAYTTHSLTPELITHELAHVRQKHSLDILFIELCQVIFWFNPGITILKRAMRLNHEFLADQATLNIHKNIPAYQQLLLHTTMKTTSYRLVNHFHFSHTKKRFRMMGRSPARARIWLKQLLVLPLLIGLMFLLTEQLPTTSESPGKNKQNSEQEEQDQLEQEEMPIPLQKYENWLRGRRSTDQPFG